MADLARLRKLILSLDSQSIVSILLGILCLLAATDLWRQFVLRAEESDFDSYTRGVNIAYDNWKAGFCVEDLRLKAEGLHILLQETNQYLQSTLSPILKKEKSLRKSIHDRINDLVLFRQTRDHLHHLSVMKFNESLLLLDHLTSNYSFVTSTSIYQIYCGNLEGAYFRIGASDFTSDIRDQCRIYYESDASDYKETKNLPHTMFELVPFSDGAFGLRSITNRYFVQLVPPPYDNEKAPWKLVVGGPSPNSGSQRFRLTGDGQLYSSLAEGYVQCKTNKDISLLPADSYGHYHELKFKPVTFSELEYAYSLLNLSSRLSLMYSTSHEKFMNEEHSAVPYVNNQNAIKICVGIPVTSKGTEMDSVEDSPFWHNLFDSFMSSIDWRTNTFSFRIYLGFDKADEIYDTGDAWQEMRTEFAKRARYRMGEQLLNETEMDDVLAKRLSIKLMHFSHLKGAPSQIVSQLMLDAYNDNYDYFYQVNDDTSITTSNWAPRFVGALLGNPIAPNLGVTGPTDSNNDKIFTHSFVHRTHIEIFGHYFPPAFKNWWSDDWISSVYGSHHSFRISDYKVDHNLKSQKKSATNRYEVDQGAVLLLQGELIRGFAKVDQWLKKKNLPRLPLPEVCGYAPLTRYVKNIFDSQ